MSRLKAILIVFSFFLVGVEMQKLGKHNFTSEWLVSTKHTLFPPMVTESKDRLIYVSFPKNFTIKLESSSIINKPCEIASELIRAHNAKNVTPLQAEFLGNGNVVVSVLELPFNVTKGMIESTLWLYLIDPQSCSYELNNLDLDTPYSLTRNLVSIVAYQDKFDVFFKSNLLCEPGSICINRYDDKLLLVNHIHKAFDYEEEGWDISTAKDYDPSEGYLYIVMRNRSTTVKHFDESFNVSRQTEVNITGSVAYWYGEDGSGSMCFGSGDYSSIECVLLDDQLKIKTQTKIVFENYNKFVRYYSIFQLKNGEAIILTILGDGEPESDEVDSEYIVSSYVQYMNLNGNVTDPILFQEHLCTFENVYEMNTFEIRDGLFCASAICNDLINTRCISPTDNRSF